MSKATVRIPSPLRSFTGGADEVEVDGGTVEQALQSLGERHSGFLERILDENGGVRRFVNVYLGSKNIRSLEGLGTAVKDGDVLAIIPAVAGGRS